jgi:endo-1,4-beta-D-glucanase Y
MRFKVAVLVLMILVYIVAAAGLLYFVEAGAISRKPYSTNSIQPVYIAPYLDGAVHYFNNNLVRANGHVDLSISLYGNNSDTNTNSEAVSYYLQWNAQAGNKDDFDKGLDFMETYMIHPQAGYLMWHLDENHLPFGDGEHIASDADLRAIKALIIAETQWGDPRYTRLIDELASALEKAAITSDGYFAPYGGYENGEYWTADEVWLSYSDFTAFRHLAERRGEPWDTIYRNMKFAVLGAQIESGLYNTDLNYLRQYGSTLDDGFYGINSMWIMVRSAESGDAQLMASALKALNMFKEQYHITEELFGLYNSEGDPLSPMDNPWVYAIVGRTAVALNDLEFSTKMMNKIISKQKMQQPWAGGIPEGHGNSTIISQFTMQESILTMQDYQKMRSQ